MLTPDLHQQDQRSFCSVYKGQMPGPMMVRLHLTLKPVTQIQHLQHSGPPDSRWALLPVKAQNVSLSQRHHNTLDIT